MDRTRVKVNGPDLVITNVRVKDGGVYTCSATNVLGGASKVISLNILKHIAIQNKLNDTTVKEGHSVRFECNFKSNPKPTITWYHYNIDGSKDKVTSGVKVINNGTGSQLLITFTKYTDSGQYVCEANNGVEVVQGSGHLTVLSKPYITKITGNGHVTANKGDTIRLWCTSTTQPGYTVSWNHPTTSSKVYTDSDGSLVISNIGRGEEGRYVCTATNSLGVDKAAVNVTVEVPPSATIQPNLLPIRGTVFFDCQADGDSPLSITWQKDGVQLDLTNKAKYLTLPAAGTSHKLLIMGASAGDAGKYSCIVGNRLGQATAAALAYVDLGSVFCSATFADCMAQFCGAHCPANCKTNSAPVFGEIAYTSTSSICRAAIHSGIIPETGTATVVWSKIGVQPGFTGVTEHGITSQSSSKADVGSVPLAVDVRNH
ncbi:hemicentin-1-like [Gigantopelta aegis]|uniref:hemicentin-1-like n=1 Tax=Gigantopelta aegis TaxID=1735272 RepID=UPI001B8884BF|nr:hemicentin-1-like [Gigantopelta aegis]